MKAVQRMVRLALIVDLLKEGPRTTAELAARCGVAERTILKDLSQLQGEPYWLPLELKSTTRYSMERS